MRIIKSLIACSLLVSGVYAENYYNIDLSSEASTIVSNGWSLPLHLNSSLSPKNSTLYTKNCFRYDDGCYPSTFRHAGVDLFTKGQYNEPVYAIDDGIILNFFINNKTKNTSVIYVKHTTNNNTNFIAVYGHVKIIDGLKKNQKVKQGELIGHVKPFNENHLHLEITNENGETDSVFGGIKTSHYNPLNFLKDNKNTKSCSSFPDISNHKYENEICAIAKANIVNGYSDGTYKPDKSINRAEFTKILVEAVEKDKNKIKKFENTYCGFSDVPTDIWFNPYVCYAKQNNIINGYPDGEFKGAKTINFAEASKIIVNTLLTRVSNSEEATADYWYSPYIKQLKSKNIDTEISVPSKLLNRAEVAHIIAKVKGL